MPGYAPSGSTASTRGRRPGVTLFTPSWGVSTPASRSRVDVVLANVGKLRPDSELLPTVRPRPAGWRRHDSGRRRRSAGAGAGVDPDPFSAVPSRDGPSPFAWA